jgi:hypothetical protein
MILPTYVHARFEFGLPYLSPRSSCVFAVRKMAAAGIRDTFINADMALPPRFLPAVLSASLPVNRNVRTALMKHQLKRRKNAPRRRARKFMARVVAGSGCSPDTVYSVLQSVGLEAAHMVRLYAEVHIPYIGKVKSINFEQQVRQSADTVDDLPGNVFLEADTQFTNRVKWY